MSLEKEFSSFVRNKLEELEVPPLIDIQFEIDEKKLQQFNEKLSKNDKKIINLVEKATKTIEKVSPKSQRSPSPLDAPESPAHIGRGGLLTAALTLALYAYINNQPSAVNSQALATRMIENPMITSVDPFNIQNINIPKTSVSKIRKTGVNPHYVPTLETTALMPITSAVTISPTKRFVYLTFEPDLKENDMNIVNQIEHVVAGVKSMGKAADTFIKNFNTNTLIADQLIDAFGGDVYAMKQRLKAGLPQIKEIAKNYGGAGIGAAIGIAVILYLRSQKQKKYKQKVEKLLKEKEYENVKKEAIKKLEASQIKRLTPPEQKKFREDTKKLAKTIKKLQEDIQEEINKPPTPPPPFQKSPKKSKSPNLELMFPSFQKTFEKSHTRSEKSPIQTRNVLEQSKKDLEQTKKDLEQTKRILEKFLPDDKLIKKTDQLIKRSDRLLKQ